MILGVRRFLYASRHWSRVFDLLRLDQLQALCCFASRRRSSNAFKLRAARIASMGCRVCCAGLFLRALVEMAIDWLGRRPERNAVGSVPHAIVEVRSRGRDHGHDCHGCAFFNNRGRPVADDRSHLRLNGCGGVCRSRPRNDNG